MTTTTTTTVKSVSEPTKMRTKRITRIHSPDSVNDKNWLKMIPKLDNFWLKIKNLSLSTFFSYKRVRKRTYKWNKILQQWIINRLHNKFKENNRYGKRQSDTTHWNKNNLTSDKNYVIVTAQQFPHKGPLNQHTCRNPNKIPKKGH